MKNLLLTLFLLFWIGNDCLAQNLLRNGGMEDVPTPGAVGGRVVREWVDCGKINESAPDIQPSPDFRQLYFEVDIAPYEGSTYLGMVVRENETYEGLSQGVRAILEPDKTYVFKVALARSPQYISDARSGVPGEKTDHHRACVFQLWGGTTYCQERELLAESIPIEHTNWEEYEFIFQPNEIYDFVSINVFWVPPFLMPYNGNLLVDDCFLSVTDIAPSEIETFTSKNRRADKEVVFVEKEKPPLIIERNDQPFVDKEVTYKIWTYVNIDSLQSNPNLSFSNRFISIMEQSEDPPVYWRQLALAAEKLDYTNKVQLITELKILMELTQLQGAVLVIGYKNDQKESKLKFLEDLRQDAKADANQVELMEYEMTDGAIPWDLVNNDFGYYIKEKPSATSSK